MQTSSAALHPLFDGMRMLRCWDMTRPGRKNINPTDLLKAPFQHRALTYDLIKRIRAYKEILGDSEPGSIDDAINDFCRDRHPEKEVEVWERIAHVFKNFTEGHKIIDTTRRREVLRVLLLMSTASKVYDSLSLTRDQLIELRYNF